MLQLIFKISYSWLAFAFAFFIPDISMIGYLVNNTVGSRIYNIAHTYIWAFILGTIGLMFKWSIFIQVALILSAHIAMDRTLGYGLKYSAEFKKTTLQKI